MQNLELKAIYPDLAQAHRLALSIGAVFTWTKTQRDTYWCTENGRLKLRQQDNEAAQLIAYQRPNERGARISHYLIYSTDQAEQLFAVLQQVIPIEVSVTKERTLYLWKNVRIHLDEVEHLGSFIEFEAQINNVYPETICHEFINFLIDHFQISSNQLSAVGYAEMLKNKGIRWC
ncbi:MAG: CYTH domain-containing protein [Calditrichaeota bacterium]|nr:MAG: CYTH domain-containing protein [Calditrichota bacterium]